MEHDDGGISRQRLCPAAGGWPRNATAHNSGRPAASASPSSALGVWRRSRRRQPRRPADILGARDDLSRGQLTGGRKQRAPTDANPHRSRASTSLAGRESLNRLSGIRSTREPADSRLVSPAERRELILPDDDGSGARTNECKRPKGMAADVWRCECDELTGIQVSAFVRACASARCARRAHLCKSAAAAAAAAAKYRSEPRRSRAIFE